MGSAAVGGSIESVSIRGRTFPVASDADATRKLGGFENALEANGDGTVRLIKTRVPWSLTGIVVEVNDARADQEMLQEVANGQDFVDMAITLASGITYQGRGQIIDALEFSTQKTTCTLSLGGPGDASQQ